MFIIKRKLRKDKENIKQLQIEQIESDISFKILHEKR
jgi:hypothetical protein